ncbi:MAG: HAMP domain-containing histidine kinase [Actinomycetales bacterium]|nr:HAMP domain-containing histidine kinase [Actinomycetales bacterium]
MVFGGGALLISATLAASTFVIARHYLLDQRQQAAIRQTYLDADLVHARLSSSGARIPAALDAADPPQGGALIVRRDGQWFTTALGTGQETIPAGLRQRIRSGRPGYVRVMVDGSPTMIIGVPSEGTRTEFYRVTPLTELDDTLRALSTVLVFSACLAAGAGIMLGLWASRKVVQPLNLVASTAAEIAGGQPDTRLPATEDPELTTLVGSFNSMVDSLQQRVESDARFAADVGHELRSPLTTLVASVELLEQHRRELPARAVQAIDLVSGDLARLQRLLDNLLHMARTDAGLDLSDRAPVPLRELLLHTLARAGKPARLLRDETTGVTVHGDKVLLERAFANLVDNADRHGEGLVAITVQRDEDEVLVVVDDEGQGVPVEDRQRIFERFATSRTARGSSSGTGLGLSLAEKTLSAHGGTLWCTDRPGRGARFVAGLPVAAP